MLKEDKSAHHVISDIFDIIDMGSIPNFIIDVGASEGSYSSNSFDLLHSYDWHGLLLEPVPKQFEILSDLYKNNKKVNCINVALNEIDGEAILYGHPNDGDGTKTGNHGASLLAHHNSPIQYNVKAISCTTLASLVEEVGILSLDTEGWDYKILNDLFINTDLRPHIIITEDIDGFPVRESEADKSTFLERFGYTQIIKGSNNVWIK
jgi:FkbM family methyltransferase